MPVHPPHQTVIRAICPAIYICRRAIVISVSRVNRRCSPSTPRHDDGNPFFPLSGVRCDFFTASSDSLFHPPMSPVFFFQSSSSPVFLSSLSIRLPRLPLPSSRNSAALFGSLSSAILSTCPANSYCSLLIAISLPNSSAPPSLPLTPPFFSCLPSLLLLFSVPVVFAHLPPLLLYFGQCQSFRSVQVCLLACLGCLRRRTRSITNE